MTSCTVRNDTWWSTYEPEALVNGTGSWPWVNITVDQYLRLWRRYQQLVSYGETFRILFYITSTLCGFGAVGNLLSLRVFTKKIKDSPSNLYYCTIGIADLLYDVLFIIHAIFWLNPETERFYACGLIHIIIKGPLFSLSLVSDFVALAVAAERAIGVRWPTKFKTINKPPVIRAAIGCCFLLGMAGRIHYSLLNQVFEVEQQTEDAVLYRLGYSAFSSSKAYALWYSISDMIAPIVIASLMCLLLAVTLHGLMKQFLKRLKPTRTGQNDERRQQRIVQMRTATGLLATATVLCLLNQTGLITYTVAWQMFDNTLICFNSSFADINEWLDRRQTYNGMYFFQGICECLSHTLHFYIYIIVSSSFRKEFKASLRIIGDSSIITQQSIRIKDTPTHLVAVSKSSAIA